MDHANEDRTARFLWGQRDDRCWALELLGDWKRSEQLPSANRFKDEHLKNCPQSSIAISGQNLLDWDSRLVAFLFDLQTFARTNQMTIEWLALPTGILRMLKLVERMQNQDDAIGASPVQSEGKRQRKWSDFFRRSTHKVTAAADFIGQLVLSIGRSLRGKAYGRRKDYGDIFRQVGFDALGIVAIISFLTGIILGFIGAVQLARFGAAIYVADLVGIAMSREMGAIMTGIIMAGRSGAAFAATLGTMRTNEELDGLKTFGISTIDFLVLPRLLALISMMPILTLFSVFIGILGGMFVAVPMFDFTILQYINETLSAIGLGDFFVGIFKGFLFAILIAGLGCWYGLRCPRNAEGVGRATTSAVVSAIIAIVATDGFFAFFFNLLNI